MGREVNDDNSSLTQNLTGSSSHQDIGITQNGINIISSLSPSCEN